MSYYTQISQMTTVLDQPHRIMLVAMCAASVEPVIMKFGGASAKELCQTSIRELWNSALSTSVSSYIVSTRKKIEELPEANCDDSNIPVYKVMVALGVLLYASGIAESNDDYARDTCVQAIECYAGFDHVLEFGSRSIKNDPRQPRTLGAMEALQIEAQVRFGELALSKHDSDDHLLYVAKESAKSLASNLSSVLPEYIRRRGWMTALL